MARHSPIRGIVHNPGKPKPRYAPRCTILTPLGAWQAARIKLLARLGATCKVAR